MNVVRIIVLLAAGLAAVAAAVFVRGAMQPAPATPAQVEAAAPAPVTARVLAAARDLEPGSRLTSGDMRWVEWPQEAVLPFHITRETEPEAVGRFTSAIARTAFSTGEPLNPARLAMAGEAGFMAAVLTPGMRAVAVPTSARAGAGGFILPNDRVDIIVATDNGNGIRTDVVVENVRVLAIDQSSSDDGDGPVVGSTATVELTPDQSRAVALAVAAGDISLALRSVADTAGGPRLPGEVALQSEQPDTGARTVRVFRYGQEQRVALGGGQ
ncbi:MAG: Flp pilus assembly protein CpaB [Oceanicaulis sp.]